MKGPLYQFFVEDHRRLEALLNQAVADTEKIKAEAYEAFRRGLLKHISMEEKILFKAIKKFRAGAPPPMIEKLRMDHAALAALLVPPPSAQIIAVIRAILADHDLIEESPLGLYDLCEQFGQEAVDALLAQARSHPDVGANPSNADPKVFDRVRRIVARAGYDFDDYSDSRALRRNAGSDPGG